MHLKFPELLPKSMLSIVLIHSTLLHHFNSFIEGFRVSVIARAELVGVRVAAVTAVAMAVPVVVVAAARASRVDKFRLSEGCS